MYRDMAIDAGAVGEDEIKQMEQQIEYNMLEQAAHEHMMLVYRTTEEPQDEDDLLGEMQFRGVEINVLPPVIEETPDITA